jgi:hypothetical protein
MFEYSRPQHSGLPCVDVDVDEAGSGHATVLLDGITIAQANGDFRGVADYGRLLFWECLRDDVRRRRLRNGFVGAPQ